MTPTCVQCHRETDGSRFLCLTCTATLKRWLLELAGHAADLEQVVVAGLTTRRGEHVQITGTPEPRQQWNEHASKVARDSLVKLVGIGRSLCEDRGVRYRPLRYYPEHFVGPLALDGVRSPEAYREGSTADMAMWLAEHVESIGLGPDALESYKDVKLAHRNAAKAVDVPAAKVWLGRCDKTVDGRMCGHDIRAAEDETEVRCPGCMTVYSVADFRISVLIKARGYLGTAAELAAMLPAFVGKPLTRKRIAYYGERGMVKRIDYNGTTVYRLGDVVDVHEEYLDRRFSRQAA